MNKAKILVVADDPQLTALLSFVLQRYGGFLVREENRPFAICTALEFSPDILILDADAPADDSGDLAADLRQLPPFAGTPIIQLSALAAGRENGRAGGEIVLAKPVDAALLIATIRGLSAAAPSRPVPRNRFLARQREDAHSLAACVN